MRFLVGLFLTFVCLNLHAAGSGHVQEKLKCAIVPADQALLAVASQPDSPLVFEDTRFFSCIGTHSMKSFRLRNRGTKAIRSLTIAGWSSGGGGFTWGWGGSTANEVVAPGQFVPMNDQDIEIIPLTKGLREELKLNGPMQGAIILMVVKVEYADGIEYSAEAASTALENYFEKTGN